MASVTIYIAGFQGWLYNVYNQHISLNLTNIGKEKNSYTYFGGHFGKNTQRNECMDAPPTNSYVNQTFQIA